MPINKTTLLPPSKKHGFAMIEVLVTSVIFAIGISGMGVLLLKTIQGTQDNAQRSQGMWIVQDLIGRMRANPKAVETNAYQGSQTSLTCADNSPKICADHTTGESYIPAAACSDTEMAAFDIWSSICGFDTPSTIKTFDNPAEFLIEPELTSNCVAFNNDGVTCMEYNVLLSWTTRLIQGSETPANRNYQNTYSMNVEFN